MRGAYPGMLLAIDPGADTGWAYFDSCRRLTACGLGHPIAALTPHIQRVRIECPRLRPKGEKNPNAILLVARNAGEWAGRYQHVVDVDYVAPHTVPKPIDNARTLARLDAEEMWVVNQCFRNAPGRNGMPAGKRHNVLDAIGIGLKEVGR